VTVDRTTDTAGAGSPAPAVSSVAPGAGSTVAGDGPAGGARPASVDVVAAEARLELDRIRRRWGELPLDRAEARMPSLRRLLADLTPGPVVPDLGPAVVVDQLTVLVWDAYAGGRGAGIPELLTAARRELG
jgi:hypothetical protein